MYDGRTRQEWQKVWRQICEMAYLRQQIEEEIVIIPLNNFQKDIDEDITLDYMWQQYNEKYREVQIVPELKKLVVPKDLFNSLGISQWFNYSFPNCLVECW